MRKQTCDVLAELCLVEVTAQVYALVERMSFEATLCGSLGYFDDRLELVDLS